MVEEATIDGKKSRFGSGKKKTGTSTEGETSPGFFGKKNKNTLVDNVPTPSTVAAGDDDSVGSSVSGGKTKKKPRAEYQKQIDGLQAEMKFLQKENETFKKNFNVLKDWAMNPPLPGTLKKKLDSDAAEVSEQEEQATDVPKSKTMFFRKKPRAEYQAEIDALLMETNRLKEENNRIKFDVKAIKEWSKKCPN